MVSSHFKLNKTRDGEDCFVVSLRPAHVSTFSSVKYVQCTPLIYSVSMGIQYMTSEKL